MDVIILDGEQKAAVATARLLGRAGLRVAVGATRGSAMACHSRFAHKTFVYTDPKVDRHACIETLRAHASAAKVPPVVYSFSDATSVALQGAKDILSDIIAYHWPDDDVFETVNNKAVTYSQAKHLGVSPIPTFLFENDAELDKHHDTFTWPMVIKPRRSVSVTETGFHFESASFVSDKTALHAVFRRLKGLTGESPLVQPLVAGEEYGVEFVCQNGVPMGTVVHHRLRSLSPTGGASVLKETVVDGRLYESLLTDATTMVTALQWTGPIMIEFKVDADTGHPRLMEINGRWWGSLPLALRAGVPLPLLYYRLLRGTEEPLTPVTNQAEVTTSFFLGEVKHILTVLFKRTPLRERFYPERKKAVQDFFATLVHVPKDVWDWRDPLPSLWQYIDVIKR